MPTSRPTLDRLQRPGHLDVAEIAESPKETGISSLNLPRSPFAQDSKITQAVGDTVLFKLLIPFAFDIIADHLDIQIVVPSFPQKLFEPFQDCLPAGLDIRIYEHKQHAIFWQMGINTIQNTRDFFQTARLEVAPPGIREDEIKLPLHLFK